jgi:hypothetical protein
MFADENVSPPLYALYVTFCASVGRCGGRSDVDDGFRGQQAAAQAGDGRVAQGAGARHGGHGPAGCRGGAPHGDAQGAAAVGDAPEVWGSSSGLANISSHPIIGWMPASLNAPASSNAPNRLPRSMMVTAGRPCFTHSFTKS